MNDDEQLQDLIARTPAPRHPLTDLHARLDGHDAALRELVTLATAMTSTLATLRQEINDLKRPAP